MSEYEIKVIELFDLVGQDDATVYKLTEKIKKLPIGPIAQIETIDLLIDLVHTAREEGGRYYDYPDLSPRQVRELRELPSREIQ